MSIYKYFLSYSVIHGVVVVVAVAAAVVINIIIVHLNRMHSFDWQSVELRAMREQKVVGAESDGISFVSIHIKLELQIWIVFSVQIF